MSEIPNVNFDEKRSLLGVKRFVAKQKSLTKRDQNDGFDSTVLPTR